MPTVEVYHEWWEFYTDTFPPLSLLTFPHYGGILSWCGNMPASHDGEDADADVDADDDDADYASC